MNLLDVEISTTRLLLKPISMEYKKNIFSEFTQEITTYMYPCTAQDISETETFINDSISEMADGWGLVLVILKRNCQEFLGCAGLHRIDRKNPELGIWLKKIAHGNKYGLETVTAIKNWADKNLEYKYLRYPVDKANIASRKIPEALGGKIVDEYYKINMSGKSLDIVEYRINRAKKSGNPITLNWIQLFSPKR
ncbi:GNAT family N-acetyltransferase [Gloeocapsopsis dulcis]|uniref:GNAT family N-acetyltransferase n=1 Tax=Gloeocapsopsis dulcis AAB1 = 1H9 TaxID=1433147 RepID=A0A6N8FYD2_9CHRO|nr:GNAT family N-acetyltransferase [Gloeocapsopsis dulcis]MUL37137.1 GNAT family N-acetyltransferase [Gloeocapsopsis dulcis AAB1 = 1H9]WNN88422.1 GNAT family N-acetyltransferase [Gloeocapsopsis dulcis]